MPMITTYLHLAKILTKFQNDFLILDKWLFNKFFVLNPDKCHFVTLGTHKTLPTFKCENIAIKNNVSEKILGAIIDNKFDFTEHLNTVCKKTNLKLRQLNRISRILSLEQHAAVINADMSLFSTIAYWFRCSATGELSIK